MGHTTSDEEMIIPLAPTGPGLGGPHVELHPAESMALTVARAQVERGVVPTPNVTAMCVLTLARLVDGESFIEAFRS